MLQSLSQWVFDLEITTEQLDALANIGNFNFSELFQEEVHRSIAKNKALTTEFETKYADACGEFVNLSDLKKDELVDIMQNVLALSEELKTYIAAKESQFATHEAQYNKVIANLKAAGTKAANDSNVLNSVAVQNLLNDPKYREYEEQRLLRSHQDVILTSEVMFPGKEPAGNELAEQIPGIDSGDEQEEDSLPSATNDELKYATVHNNCLYTCAQVIEAKINEHFMVAYAIKAQKFKLTTGTVSTVNSYATAFLSATNLPFTGVVTTGVGLIASHLSAQQREERYMRLMSLNPTGNLSEAANIAEKLARKLVLIDQDKIKLLYQSITNTMNEAVANGGGTKSSNFMSVFGSNSISQSKVAKKIRKEFLACCEKLSSQILEVILSGQVNISEIKVQYEKKFGNLSKQSWEDVAIARVVMFVTKRSTLFKLPEPNGSTNLDIDKLPDWLLAKHVWKLKFGGYCSGGGGVGVGVGGNEILNAVWMEKFNSLESKFNTLMTLVTQQADTIDSLKTELAILKSGKVNLCGGSR